MVVKRLLHECMNAILLSDLISCASIFFLHQMYIQLTGYLGSVPRFHQKVHLYYFLWKILRFDANSLSKLYR